jgi:hypothetical protein
VALVGPEAVTAERIIAPGATESHPGRDQV